MANVRTQRLLAFPRPGLNPLLLALMLVVITATTSVVLIINSYLNQPKSSSVIAPAAQPVEAPVTPESLLAVINAERAKANVPALQLDARLNASAQAVADTFVLDDTPHLNAGRRGTDVAHEFAPECKTTSENISWGHRSTAAVVAGWVGSPSHYAAMIKSNFQTAGFGIAQGNVVVNHFCAY